MQTSMAFRSNTAFVIDPYTVGSKIGKAAKSVNDPQLFFSRGKGLLVITASGIADGQKMKLRITDLLGREVFRDRTMSQGNVHSHTYIWDNAKASGGTYIVTLQAGDQRLQRSVTLVK
jgi:hypothetical protein